MASGIAVHPHHGDPGDGPALSALRFCGVSLLRQGRTILDRVDWEVEAGQRWVVLGPNGSGKTTLIRLAGAELRPSAGSAQILGRQVGRVDLRALRVGIALMSGAVTRAVRPTMLVRDVVLAGKHASLEAWWHEYGVDDRARALGLLAGLGVAGLADRAFEVVSEGERQQVLLARALMAEPRLLLLDEPAAGLDLGARERLMGHLRHLAGDPGTPPLVLVTHHAEEIPENTTHAALLAGGRVVTAGPIEEALTDGALSACFGLPVRVGRDGGRWWARARPA
ncbi:MAG: ABC transporter ATP-binding protein [Acidimicrobiales bacterium]